ncbi:MAG TPA: LysM peptidoglycan-binding domain-containing protein [Anaerolineae bacterium]|nr:LysM peptidoglycan-binding domain-containing protein [Anaerolineae bacterium]
MLRLISRFIIGLLLVALVIAPPIGLVTARSLQPQSGELLSNPGFEEPFSAQGIAAGWQAWYVTPDGVTYPTSCGDNSPETCKPYGVPGYQPAQPQDSRVPPRSISGNAQKWGSSYYVYIAGVYQQVSGLTPGARLQFSAFTQAFNCSDDGGCFGPAGRKGYSYEPGENSLRVGIDPTGGTNPYSSNIVWSSYANPLDAYVQQAVEAVAQSDKVTVFVWSAPQYPEKHLETFVESASLVVTGQGPVPTGTTAAQPTQPGGTPAPTLTLSPNATTYTVVAGDTMSLIAQRFGLTLSQLMALNPQIVDPAQIEVGQVINVSGQASTPVATLASTATPQPSPTLAPSATTAPSASPTTAANPVATSTSPTSTPMAIAASSGLCVQAFDDLNNDRVREADEPLVADVIFDVKSVDGKTTANYTTTGTLEPYCFSTLPDGRYAVNTQLPADRLATTDSAWQMSLLADTNISIMLGTHVDVPPTAEPTTEPTPIATVEAAAAGRGNNSASLALLGGGALILLAGVAMFLGLRSRGRAA